MGGCGEQEAACDSTSIIEDHCGRYRYLEVSCRHGTCKPYYFTCSGECKTTELGILGTDPRGCASNVTSGRGWDIAQMLLVAFA